nr:ribonuclease Z-like [Nerophis lumbriciformis]
MLAELSVASFRIIGRIFTLLYSPASGENPVHSNRCGYLAVSVGALLLMVLTCSAIANALAEPVAEKDCRSAPFALQVLGSGGPIADDARSSSGYLVWINGKARVLVDAGSGTFIRFGQAGATFKDLDLIALSHFHADHAAALPALLKSGYFSDRRRPLAIAGPSAGGPFPSLKQFLTRLLDRDHGAFSYLAGYLDGSAGLAQLLPMTVEMGSSDITEVYKDDLLLVTALAVPHGIVPAVAYAIHSEGKTIVLGSDQNGSNPEFVRLAKNADLLLLHAVIPQDAGRAARALHATPSRLADIARAANPAQVVLSHWMARSLNVHDKILAAVRAGYDGPVAAAEDLACYSLSGRPAVQ